MLLCSSPKCVQRLQRCRQKLKVDGLGQDFDPVGQDQQEAPAEDWAVVRVTPFVLLDKLKHVVHVKALLKLYFVLFLNFANDTD